MLATCENFKHVSSEIRIFLNDMQYYDDYLVAESCGGSNCFYALKVNF